MTHRIQIDENSFLNVEDIGNGQPVVFLHGWPANNQMFEYQMNFIVEQGCRYIGIDYRGFGLSDTTADGYDYDSIADDIQKVVEVLDLKDIIVVGFSVGGALALKYAAKYNDSNLKKMVLLGPAAPSFVQREDYPYGMKTDEVTDLVNDISSDQPKAISDFGSVFFQSNIDVSDEYKHYFTQLTLTSSLTGTIKLAESLRDEDLREEVKNIDLPVYALHGTEDAVCPIQFSEELEKTMPNYQLTELSDTGHALFFEKKDEINEFLGRVLAK